MRVKIDQKKKNWMLSVKQTLTQRTKEDEKNSIRWTKKKYIFSTKTKKLNEIILTKENKEFWTKKNLERQREKARDRAIEMLWRMENNKNENSKQTYAHHRSQEESNQCHKA